MNETTIMLKEKLKNAVRFFYDLQRLRMQSDSRADKKAKKAEAHLDEDDKQFLSSTSKGLEKLEKEALKEVGRLSKDLSIYKEFLEGIRGVGPTMRGLLCAEIDIEQCETVSKLWRWCGLAVVDGVAEHPVKGDKLHYNPMMKSKMLGVLGDSFIKSCAVDAGGYHVNVPVKENGKQLYEPDPDNPGKERAVTRRVPLEGDPPYRKYYDEYKHRKESTMVDQCMGCRGTGKVTRVDRDADVAQGTKKPRSQTVCPNCNGTGGPAPWGACPEHRHKAARRYMVKRFLADLWVAWRTLEGLSVRPPYAEEYLNRAHHGPSEMQQVWNNVQRVFERTHSPIPTGARFERRVER